MASENMFDPKYRITDKIVASLTAIAEAKAIIERARLLPKQEIKLRRQAKIRMTHSSTAIEGNQLDMRQIEAVYANKKIDAPAREIFEVKNYLNALKFIEQAVAANRTIDEKILLKIHQLVTDKTLPKEQSRKYRKIPIYVVRRRIGFPDQIIYTGPMAEKISLLCSDLIKWVNQNIDKGVNPVILAGIAHQEIAAIHPFTDGNGRTARAVATLILYKSGYDFRRLFALEDYYNKDRQKYYQAINIGATYDERETDFTRWLEYFVEGFKEEIDNVKSKVIALASKKIDDDINSQIYLSEAQLEILEFLDQVGRITAGDVTEILECPKRTAQLYLQQLKKLKIIQQTGKGPSAAYILT